jgi:hypothetical protein
MKAKNAQAVIRAKFNRFLEHIRDDYIRKLVADNTIVTGGAIASLLLGEEVHDFDLYFRTKEVAQRVAEHYCGEFAKNPPPRFKSGNPIQIVVIPLYDRVKIMVKSAGVASENDPEEYKYFERTDPESGDAFEYVSKVLDVIQDADEKEKPKYRPVFLSTNAITLSDKIQLVTRFFGEPDELHKNYDFVHVTNYWTSWGNKLVLRPEAIEALLAKELRYVGSKYPLCSIIRTRKFIRRGWSINAGQYLKMVMQLHGLDLNNIDVLEEQLTGVDVAYFLEVISALRERDDKRVDNAYLVELIDRIF